MGKPTPAGAPDGAGTGAPAAQPDGQGTPPQPDPEGAQPSTGQDPAPEPQPLSDADIKANPWVAGLRDEVTELRKFKAERDNADAEAAQKAEVEKGNFEKALQMEKDKVTAAQADALAANIKASLVQEGAQVTTAFVKIAVAEFDAEKFGKDFDAFAKSIKENEAYAPFFSAEDESGKKKPNAPGKPGKGSKAGSLTNDEILALTNSSDPKDRAKGLKYLEDFHDQHGKLPDGYSGNQRR